MGKRVIKFEFEDEDGGKFLFKLEGEITREKILKLLDIYELMSLKIRKEKNELTQLTSLHDKILNLIEDELMFREFNSRKLQELYEDRYNEPIKLSVISTYLRRLYDNGILDRKKDERRGWKYALRVEGRQTLKRRG